MLLTVLLAACQQGRTAPELQPDPIYQPSVVAEAVGRQLALPAPSSLSGRSGSAFGFDSRLCLGNQWEASLPNNRVTDSTFSPQYAGASGRKLGDCAYAVYGFGELSLYHGPPVVKLRWLDTLDQPQNVYIALANPQLDRWDWFKMPATGDIYVPGLETYIGPSSESLMAVVSLDNGDFGLDYVLWGDSGGIDVSIQTDLNQDPLLNMAPLTLNIDASGSVSYGSQITSFNFDWEDDGVFDVIGNTDGMVQHVFDAGSQRVAVRVSDALGQSGTRFLNFVAIDPNNQAPIASFTLTPNNGDGPLEVSCDASSSSDADGSIREYRWDFDGDGQDDQVSQNAQAQYTFALAGNNEVRLTVKDDYFAEATQIKSVIVLKGWHGALADSNAHVTTPVALCTDGTAGSERACMAYVDVLTYQLLFRRATDRQASSWGFAEQPDTNPNGLTGPVSMVTSVGSGVPIVCYGEYTGEKALYTVTADNEAGSAWLNPVLVDGSNSVGLGSQMTLVNTVPVIAAASDPEQGGPNDVYYYTAGNLDATQWNAPKQVLMPQAGISYGRPAIGTGASGLFKKPILFVPYTENGSNLNSALVTAKDISGVTWNSAQQVSTYMEVGGFMIIEGLPTFCGATTHVGGTIGFYRALNGDGTSWPGLVADLLLGGGQAVALLHGGVPEIYYYDSVKDDIFLLRASDALGDDWDQVYKIALNLGGSGGQLGVTLVDGEPVLAYSRNGIGGQFTVHSASWY